MLLVDRKGDLCSYANPHAWEQPLADPARQARRSQLRDQIEVALYTPGSSEGRGRPLSISIVPAGLGRLQDSGERQQIAQFAAMSLGGMMGYKTQGLDLQRIAILKSAIEVLAELHPQTSPTMKQAVALFDEADLYLPAQTKPATKEPFENLLKRSRSAGVGLFLATQSPGDLDYMLRDQISTWYLGKIKEQTALNKLKPMLSEAKTNVAAKLPNQQTGEFYAINNSAVTSLMTDMSLIQAQQVPIEEILTLAEQTTG